MFAPAVDHAAPGPGGGTGEQGTFRPDIEGLRAVAVVLVLLFHAGVPGTAGGYVGVDVFFVLSGFLITGLLLRELDATGTVSLARFYARRARRLLPASAATLLVTVALSALLLPPLRVPDVATDAAAAAVYAANVHFALQATDYLAAELAPSPVLHFWSLGVEEQFYLFWPALLLLVARRPAGRRTRIALLTGATVAGSFALSLWLTSASAPWAFFSLPTRAWELGIGALLALAATRLARTPPGAAGVAGWLGLAMIVASAAVIGTATPFPGVAALLPTVGTALVVAAGMVPGAQGPGTLLSRRPFRFLGRISYSLYLWHWPMLVLPAAALGGELPLAGRVALALAAIPVAAASQRWLEEPIRRGRLVGVRPRANLAAAGALTLVVAASSLAVGATTTRGLGGGGGVALGPDATPVPSIASLPTADPSGEPAVPASGPLPEDLLPSLADARHDKPATGPDGCHVPQADPEPADCVYGDPGAATTVVLLGDSHAEQWFPAVERLALEQGWRLVTHTKSACSAADVTVWNTSFKRAYTECAAWRDAVLERIAAERPDLVIVSTSRRHEPLLDGRATDPETARALLRAGIARSLERLVASASHVAVLADTPRPGIDVPVCLSEHRDAVEACAAARTRAVDEAWLADERAVAAAAGATFVDPTDWICTDSVCPAVVGRYLTFRDGHHIATPFAAALRGRLLAGLPTLGD